MKNGYEKVLRIKELMMELQEELNTLPAYESELNVKLKELDKETVDILHIAENVDMTDEEKIELFDRTHDLREERREVKYLLSIVIPVSKVTQTLSRTLNENSSVVTEVLESARPGISYSFRSQSGFDLLKRIVPDFAERSPIYLYSPSISVSTDVKSAKRTSKASVVTATAPVAPVATALPPVEIAPLKESDKSYQIVRVCNKWTLRDGLTVILDTLELKEVIEYLFVNGWQSVATDSPSKAQLKRDLREEKKQVEADTNRFVHCSRLQQRLF